MIELFKITGVKAKTEFKKYASAVDGQMEMVSLESYIQEALSFILQVVDQDTLEALSFYYKNNTLTGALEELLPYVQKPLADFAIYQWINRGNVRLNDKGITMSMTDQEKPAFQYMTNDLKDEQLESGYNGLEKLQQFLEANISSYPSWAASSKSTLSNKYYIKSAAEFSSYVNIDNSRRTFTALFPLMQNAEFMCIEKHIGAAQSSALKSSYYSGFTTAEITNAVEKYIRPAFARYVIADAINKLPIITRADSILVKEYEAYSDVNKAQRKPDKELLISLKNAYIDEANNYMAELIIYMDSNDPETNFPLYNTDKRLPQIDLGDSNPNNRQNPSIFSAL